LNNGYGPIQVKFGGHIDTPDIMYLQGHVLQLAYTSYLPYMWGDYGIGHIDLSDGDLGSPFWNGY